MDAELIKNRLHNQGLKATPKRMSILEAVSQLGNHPTAEEIINHLKDKNIVIATATVYKALDILVAKNIIAKVKTGTNIIRYDAVVDPHHHLYSSDPDIIKDYKNEEISNLLDEYFKIHKIKNFDISEIKLQIIGKFTNKQV